MRFTSPRWNISDDPDAGWKAVDWSVHTHQATVRGRRITYADIGSGPATVLVHGQGGSWQWWLRVLPTVSPHRRVIAVDLPGFGGSDPIARGDVFTEHVATIIGLLDHLGLADATIAGHSMGGLVALQVACDHPDRVAGLMLIDAGGANISARRLALIVTGLRPSALSSRFQHAAAIAVNRVTPHAVTCPSLILWGVRDRILPVSTGHVLASKIPDARFVPLENVGHCVMVEAADQFSQLLIDFTQDS
jgi:pimeloyl-ACP methyl ester carboxylesterase